MTPGSDSGDNGNGRVTLAKIGGEIAVLGNKIDNLIESMRACKLSIDDQENQIKNNGNRITRLETKFEDIDVLKRAIYSGLVAFVGWYRGCE